MTIGRPTRGRAGAAVFAFILVAPMAAQESDPLSDEAVEARIQLHRTAEVTIRLTDAAGAPLADRPFTVEQTGHRFLFGCNLFGFDAADDSPRQAAYRERFVSLFNFATLPFYWGYYERVEGEPDESRLTAMADWCAERGIAVKGHPLVWHEVTPAWLADRSEDEVRDLLLGRIRRDAGRFAGRIGAWDVLNEPMVMPDFGDGSNPISRLSRRMGVAELIGDAFAEARIADPDALLILNDYITDERFERVARKAIAAGNPIDAIGIQSHMHSGEWTDERTWEVLKRFEPLDRPLHFTELTVVSGRHKDWRTFERRSDWDSTPEGEARQGDYVRRFYTILFSHPKVEAITWWDLADGRAWQGAPAGLLRADMTPKPAYLALHELIRQRWWTGPTELTTNGQGVARVRLYLGAHRLRLGGRDAEFSVDRPGEQDVTISVGDAG